MVKDLGVKMRFRSRLIPHFCLLGEVASGSPRKRRMLWRKIEDWRRRGC